MDDRKMKKAVLYFRVSTKDQADNGFSLDNQLQQMLLYCKFNNLEVKGKPFVDKGISGRKKENRPEFLKALQAAEKGDAFVVPSFDRFSRNLIDTVLTVNELNEKGVEFHSIKEKVDTTTALGGFLVSIFGGLAQMESKRISERVTPILRNLKKEKKVYCKVAPLGFNASGDRLVPNIEEQQAIQRAKELKGKGRSYQFIADVLNLSGVAPKRGGKRFYASTVRSILNNNIHA